MKVSRTWLQTYFDAPLPDAEAIADALTFHAFEIEEVAGDILDIKVLPDRAAYALSHRGIALEVSAVLGIPLKRDPLREALPTFTETPELTLSLDEEGKTYRKMGALVRGVKVGPSPEWLKAAIESLGQRSINNIVDATNYVTLDMGQPLHAFDAGKLATENGTLTIGVRAATDGEEITVLSGETYKLPEGALVIMEGATGRALDIAGVKGGLASAITKETTDIFVSVCNFDGPRVRKTAQVLNLFTDASLRFQNKISPELAAYGMRDILALIKDIAGGTVMGVNDVYPNPQSSTSVSVSLEKINGLLGSSLSSADVEKTLARLGLTYTTEGDSCTVAVPFERRDLTIAEDLVEEVGRILGYDTIEAVELPQGAAPAKTDYHGLERIRDYLRERGYTELSTQSFAQEGDIVLANPLDKTRPALRKTLADTMTDSLTRAVHAAPRVLGPVTGVHLFEIGSVFTKEGEYRELSLGHAALSGKTKATVLDDLLVALTDDLGLTAPITRHAEGVATISLESVDLVALGKNYTPLPFALGPYRSFSVYPFALRDIAVWTPAGTEESEVANLILKEADEHLVRLDLFDRFEKDERISYAFRIVFESSERTLTDQDLDPAMARITDAMNAKEGWEVR